MKKNVTIIRNSIFVIITFHVSLLTSESFFKNTPCTFPKNLFNYTDNRYGSDFPGDGILFYLCSKVFMLILTNVGNNFKRDTFYNKDKSNFSKACKRKQIV